MARLTERLLRGLFVLLAGAVLLAAAWVSLGRTLVPLVAEYRGELQARLGAALGQELRIGELRGEWHGLAPLLVLEDLQLRDGDEALHLERLRLVPDLLASLRTRSLRLARIELEGARFGLQQAADGHWRLKGRVASDTDAASDPAGLFAALGQVAQVLVLDARLSLEPWQQDAFSLGDIDLQLDNAAPHLTLNGRLRLPDGQPLALRLDSHGLLADWRSASGRLYLSLPQSDWARWLPASLWPADWRLEQLAGGGELWLEGHAASLQRAALRLHVAQLAVSREDQPRQLSDLALAAWWQREADGWSLQVGDLAARFAAQRIDPGQLQLRHRPADTAQPWQLQVERLELAPLAQLAEHLVTLPPQAGEILTSLAPHGEVRDLQMHWRPRDGAWPELGYQLRLQRVGVQGWQNVPAFANVSGRLSGNLDGGELLLDADDFMLHLQTLFPEPWHYRKARARLSWSLDAEAFTLASPLMRLSGEEGELAGDMLIRLRRAADAEDYMDLQVGLREGRARYTARYLPTRAPGLSPALADWLGSAIGDGSIEQGLFLYQGSLNRNSVPEARALGLYFQVRDTELAYQPDWPPLSGVAGEVFVEDSGVRVNASAARVLDSQLHDVQAQVLLEPGRVPHLKVSGQVRSSLGDGLKILQDTPLGHSGSFAGWQGEGPLDGALQLDIPLARSREPVRAVVDFATRDATLQIAEPALRIDALQGRFRYDTQRGLSAERVQGVALGQPLRGRIRALGRAGQPHSQLELSGRVGVARLATWLGQDPAALPLDGNLPYRLWLDLDGADSRLRVASDLRGVRIDLPAPLGKPAAEPRDSQWRMTLSGAERRYWLDYAGRASLSLALPPGQWAQARGELRLGDTPARLPAAAGLYLRGHLEQVDLGDWQAWLARRPALGASGLGSALRGVELRLGAARWGDLRLDALKLALRPQEQGWQLQLDGTQVRGEVLLPASTDAPLQVRLRELRLPARESAEEKARREAAGRPAADPLADFDPRSLPAMQVDIAALYFGTERMGRWRWQVRPQGEGVRFENLALELNGLRLSGRLDWQGRGAALRSRYVGQLEGDDLAEVLLAWGFAPSLSSREFRVAIDGGWPGSPALAGLRQFTGTLDAQARQGQLLEVDSSASALRVFGLLNISAIGRRLRLDFSDLIGRGLSYDRIEGRLSGVDGVFLTREPLRLEGPSTRLELDGQLNIPEDRIAARLRVTLPLSNNLPLAALLAGALPVAGALLIVDQLVGDRLSKVASVEYRVDGPWQDPQISLFGKP